MRHRRIRGSKGNGGFGKKRIVRIVAVFLAVVFAGTVMARWAATALTPRVEVMYGASGTISRDVLREVVVESDKKTPVYVYPELMVSEIYVSSGKQVSKGDRLLRVDPHEAGSLYLEKKLERKNLMDVYWYTWGDERNVMDDKLADIDADILRLETLMENDGLICSEFDGVISELRLEVGRRTTDEAAIVVMEKADEYTLRMSVTEGEKQYIETGDSVTVQIDDRKVNTEVSALYKNGANDQCYVVEAVISGDVFNVGDSVLTDISHQSDKYDFVVPVSAIHADTLGSYVLVERSKETILGTETVAAKVYVKVGDTNNYEVGISGEALTSDDRIIVSADKKVEAGDTVLEKTVSGVK